MNINRIPNYSAQWGRTVEQGAELQKAFPYFYSFVNPDYEDPSNIDTLLGITVGPQSYRSVPVILDTDYNFKLIWIRFSVYVKIAGVYYSYDPTFPFEANMGDIQRYQGTPFINSLRASFSSRSNSSTTIFGGANADPIVYNTFPNIINMPLEVKTIQGYDNGIGQARISYLAPAGGTLMFDLYNTNPDRNLIVSGTIYGMKVRV